MLRLADGAPTPAPSFTFSDAGSLSVSSGSAATRNVNGTLVAAQIGMAGTAAFTGLEGGAGGGTRTVLFDYINVRAARRQSSSI